MSPYWSKTLRQLEPYVPGEQPQDRKYIKLNTNENPYPPSPRVLEAIRQAADESLRLYPDPDCRLLRETIAAYYGLQTDQVFVGNGSDEVLAFSFLAFFDRENAVLFPDITYSFYPVYADLFDLEYHTVPLDEDFNIPETGFRQENGGVILSNPKAPTAQYLPLSSIRRILEDNPDRAVIIDEAYIDFGGESAVSLIDDYPNLLVIQTLSKSRSLAGMRIGFAMGHRELIEGLNRIKNSFNSYTLDRLAITAAVEAFRDEEYFQETRTKIIRTRERVSEALRQMDFTVLDSRANFIFVRHPNVKAEELFSYLKEKGILVRYFNKPRVRDFLRVTIGTDREMDSVLQALKERIR